MQELSELHKNVLGYCVDDDTDLRLVVWVVTRHLVHQQPGGRELLETRASKPWDQAIDPTVVRKVTLQIVRDLLEAGLIDAGLPTEHGTWESWNLSPVEAMHRIEAEWDTLGHPPNTGDIVWFLSTIEGDRVLSQGAERNTAGES